MNATDPETSCRGSWFRWFLVGLAAAFLLQWLQASTVGGWSGLVAVGEDSALRPFIEESLGQVATTRYGHDGQFTLAIALDPWIRSDAHLAFDHGAYRYRRILHPLIGGGFGLLGPRASLVGIIVTAAIGMGIAVASLSGLAARLRVGRWTVAGVLANPGVWLSVQLVTSDALALGLALLGILLWVRSHRRWSALVFALAVLTKDQYILVPLSVAGWTLFSEHRTRDAAALVGAVVAPILAWSIWLDHILGDGLSVRGNIAVLGLLKSIPAWPSTAVTDQILVALTLLAVVGAAISSLRSGSLARWLTLPWVGLALFSSSWVWDVGNNAARAFTPLWVFGLLVIALPARRPIITGRTR